MPQGRLGAPGSENMTLVKRVLVLRGSLAWNGRVRLVLYFNKLVCA